MFALLLGTIAFVAVLTLVAVYGALVLAHRTDEIVNAAQDDGTFIGGRLPGHA